MLATSPLLEAFGNAQTVLNHNSSRYGKFLMLQFDLSGRIMGCTIQTYLLEKVRIVQQQPGERGYHVLYYLAAAAPAALRAELQLGAISSYQYLGGAKAVAAKGQEQDERAMFASTEAAMRAVGFGPTEMRWVWALLGAVLGLGNVTFQEEGDATAIADHKARPLHLPYISPTSPLYLRSPGLLAQLLLRGQRLVLWFRVGLGLGLGSRVIGSASYSG